MHLKSYPKLMRSELRLDPVQTASQRSSLFVGQQGALLRTCSSHHGNMSGGRLPLGVISPNTLRCNNANSNNLKGRMKLLPSPPPPGRENEAVGVYQTTDAETADAPLDVWTVIKPGNVREKIAIFASDSATCSEPPNASSSRTTPSSTNHAPVTGPTRAAKAKGSWEENGNAKRRRRSGSNQNLHHQHVNMSPQHSEPPRPKEAEPEDNPKVSVVEMVAFLEHRATEQMDTKPLLTVQRSSASITLSRAPPPEAKGEEPDSVRVLDMVARLESECLRRRAEGELSRSSSLRRTVGRVLLAAAAAATDQQSHASCPPSSEETITCSEKTKPPLSTDDGRERRSQTEKKVEVEPVPGLLFLSPSLHIDSAPLSPSDTPTDSETVLPLLHSSDSNSQSEKQKQNRGCDVPSPCSGVVVTVCRRPSASQDFLLMRQRLQQLLEPQPYLAILPHHLLVSIFVLLPTQSLAALKCTCHYFKFIIENYGVRPADSLWVSDPRYRDDPCKQCKRRYGRGDVSLCRWHHKPYCQALPYGPGYWMCCHGAHRDTPGCNVGLHDNRWVPAFHSINVPIYRGRRAADSN